MRSFPTRRSSDLKPLTIRRSPSFRFRVATTVALSRDNATVVATLKRKEGDRLIVSGLRSEERRVGKERIVWGEAERGLRRKDDASDRITTATNKIRP